MAYHVPVLAAESIEGLKISPDGTYVDLTFGGGGHSRLILETLGPKGRLLAFDQDEDALQNAIDDKRFTLIRGNFRYFRNFLRYYGVEKVNGILADLGVSSYHLDNPDRGFSFRFSGPLDMRMNRRSDLSAKKIINEYSQQELSALFKLYGELPNARKLAAIICNSRTQKPIETVETLSGLIEPHIPGRLRNKVLAQLFQAIRIEVNRELDALKSMLEQSARSLFPEGRLVVISYHSLEDRLVKNYLRTGTFDGKAESDLKGHRQQPFEPINRKVIVPSDEEIEQNNRARSAKLRIGRKL